MGFRVRVRVRVRVSVPSAAMRAARPIARLHSVTCVSSYAPGSCVPKGCCHRMPR